MRLGRLSLPPGRLVNPMVSRVPTSDACRAGVIPPRRQHAQRAQRDRGRGRRAQHLRAQPNRDGAGIRERGETRPARCRPRDPPAASANSLAPHADPEPVGRRLVQRQHLPPAATSSAIRWVSAAVDSTPSTGGMYARRDCRAAERATARQRRRPLSARAPCQRATQRSACQATNASAPASVANSIANSERSDFGSACTTVTAGWTARTSSDPDPGTQPVAAGVLDDAAGQAAGAVAEHQLLTGTDASHRGGVEAFVAVDDGQLTGRPAAHRRRTASHATISAD